MPPNMFTSLKPAAAKTTILTLPCLLLATAGISARTIKVTPATDLAEVISKARSNTTIVLAPGTYRLPAREPHSQAILLGNKSNIIITGMDREKTRLELAPDAKFGFYIGSNLSGLTIQKLTISGNPPLDHNTHAIGNYSGSTNNKAIRFTDLSIKNVAVGISIATSESGSYQEVSIDRNIIGPTIGTAAGSGYGVHIENARQVTVSGNLFRECTRHSIYLARGAKGSGIRLEENLILNHDPESKQSRWYCAAVACSRTSDVTIARNLIVNPPVTAISVEPDEYKNWPSRNINLLSNRVIGARRVGLWVTTGESCAAIANKVTLDPAPPDPQWCLQTSSYDFARGKETSSKIEAPLKRWQGSDYTAELAGQLFILKDGVLDRADPKDWSFKTCPKKWSNVLGMVAIEHALRKGEHRIFIVTDSGIDEVNPRHWNIRSSRANLKGSRFVTAAGGFLHILKGDNLYRLSPESPNSRPLKKSFPDIEWLCPLGDNLCIANAEGRHLINAKTLEGLELEAAFTKE